MQDLESLRARVLERLQAIETLARERPEPANPESAIVAVQESLKGKAKELDEMRRRVQEQAKRSQQDWDTSLSQLEQDRRLLADAWERVERERIAFSSAPEGSQSPRAAGQITHGGATGTQSGPTPTVPIRSAGPDAGPHNPVAQAILRQFQTLRSDVRQSAQIRRAAR
jgi:hypothetical protein